MTKASTLRTRVLNLDATGLTAEIRHPSKAAYLAGCLCDRCHPSAAAYNAGCKCDPCLARRRRQEKLRLIYGVTIVDLEDRVILRLNSLVAEGYGTQIIADMVGTHRKVIAGILAGQRQRIKKTTARRILNLTRGDLIRGTPDTRFVPSHGSIRRLHALQALGWPTESLTDDPTGKRYLNRLTWMGQPVIHAGRARWIMGIYDQHSMLPGPSPITRARAARKGYAPPLAWDDETIDDPAAVPDLGTPPDTNAERQSLYDQGLSDQEIADAVGSTACAIRLWRVRNGKLPANRRRAS